MLLVNKLILPNKRLVDLEIVQGKSYILQGANGSGKTLLLRGLAALYPLSYHRFYYQDKTLAEWNIEAYRSEVLYLSSLPAITDVTNIEEYFKLPFTLKIYRHHKSAFDPWPLLRKWNLSTQKISELSSGQKQIISFLRALTLKAKILLLDEPTSHLDQTMTLELENLLMRWKDQTHSSFILVSHHQQQIERLNQEIILF